jgi:hypothetical protein
LTFRWPTRKLHTGVFAREEEHDMKRTIALALAAALALPLTLGGCSNNRGEGPAERAGKSVDRGVEKSGDVVEDAADKAGGAIESAGDKVEDATD